MVVVVEERSTALILTQVVPPQPPSAPLEPLKFKTFPGHRSLAMNSTFVPEPPVSLPKLVTQNSIIVVHPFREVQLLTYQNVRFHHFECSYLSNASQFFIRKFCCASCSRLGEKQPLRCIARVLLRLLHLNTLELDEYSRRYPPVAGRAAG